MVKHQLFYFIGSCVTIVCIGILVFFIAIVSKRTPNPKAETTGVYVVTVNKTPTISIYVSGPGVSKIESTLSVDTYEVVKGTLVAFRAVNESKIFTGWNFVPAISDINVTDAYVVFAPTSDLIVDVSRRDPLKTDFGQYMSNCFIIDKDTSLISLATMFEVGNDLTKITDEIVQYYDLFFVDDDEYISYTEDKKTGICDIFFNKIQNGYFNVTTSFTTLVNNYFGIGNKAYPFKGVMCGLNKDDISNIFINIETTEMSGDNYCGLFGVIEEEAVIRNLNITTAISFIRDSANADNIFAGGLAGVIRGSYLYNLKVTVNGTIDNTQSANIYLGGLAGKTEGSTKMTTFGLSDDSKILCKLNDCEWILTHHSSGKSMMAGGVAGYANNTYIKNIEINVSNYIVKSVSIASDSYLDTNNSYIGNVFGYYENNIPVEIKNVEIVGQDSENLTSIISSGNAYVSGCIGYINSTQSFHLGHINFNVNGEENIILAQSLSAFSCTNLYTGGLIAKMAEQSIGLIVATKEFSQCINILEIDGETKYVYDPIFAGNYNIQSMQNGISNGTTFGKAVSGGLVGYGYINMNGTGEERTNIIISTDSYSFIVNATQSITSTTSQDGTTTIMNDKEHCVAGLVYGLFSTSTKQLKVENINYFASGFEVTTTRSMGSTTGGDLHTGGIVGYSYAVDYENITVLFNNSAIRTEALSYDGKWGKDVASQMNDDNNAYTGGVVGEFSGQQDSNASMKNVMLCGYDYNKHNTIGTNLKITSIQNTNPPKKDYCGENYCGGIIGRAYRFDVDGITYNGVKNNENYIFMQSNENPDTSFCGGIIGYIKNNENNSLISSTVQNCLIENVIIKANATCILGSDIISIPDMYCGGIIGGSFNGNAPSSSLTIKGCRVYNVEISAIGHERQIVYGAGIIGINTWQGSTMINDCYVYDCNINSCAEYSNIADSIVTTYAAGIIAECNTNTTIKNCCVMDTNIVSQNNNPLGTSAHVGGISARNQRSLTISGCYSNAQLVATATEGKSVNYYGIAANITTSNGQSYYIKESAHTDADENECRPITVATRTIENTPHEIFSAFSASDKYRTKYYPILIDNNFTINNIDKDNMEITISKKEGVDNITDVLKVWVNVKNSGDSKGPNEYVTDFEKHEAGWFLFADVLLKTRSSSTSSGDKMTITNITYPLEEVEYDYKEDTDTFINLNPPYNSIDTIGYEEDLIEKTIFLRDMNDNKQALMSLTVYVYDNIPNIRVSFTVTNENQVVGNYYPVFFDDGGKVLSSFNDTGYGKYQYSKLVDVGDNLYEWYFSPNAQLSFDVTFYLGFKIDASDDYSDYVFEINLVSNKTELVGFTYADYTIPENYFDLENFGTEQNPWIIFKNDTIKIIPIFTKKNDYLITGQKTMYESEENIQSVNYTLNTVGENYATIYSNGELKTGDTAVTDSLCYVTITLKDDSSQTVNVYFQVVDAHKVLYSSVGADVWGLLSTYGETDYVLHIDIRYGYNGIPTNFTVKINNASYDEYNKEKVIEFGWIKDQNGSTLANWDGNAEHYTLVIPHTAINADITIDIEFQAVYLITFDSQSQVFNPETAENHIIKYKVPIGTSFDVFFNDDFLYNVLYPWVDEKSIFGYVFMGFYLIDNANSITSYGKSFKEMIDTEGLSINTSYTFYARWSFLIEIIDAPGTHIKTSFAPDFLSNYGVDEYGNELSEEELEKLNISRAVTIPINNNQGYAFTIEKDKDFIGKASPKAFICHKDGDEKAITEISIEKYHENMYLYRIPAEVITGYLVIVTSVSSSEFIVGENTSQIMDNILPEDGVYTFKYVANHFNKPDCISYIYNSGIEGNPDYNLELDRNVLLRFYKEVYDTTTHQTKLVERSLAKGTIVELYYHQYKNGEYQQSEDIVGTYTVDSNDITQLLLSDFKKLNQNEQAFHQIKFKDLLNGTDTLSEVYYFVITPPNGYTEYEEDEYGSIMNHYIYIGYYDQNKAGEDDPFVNGARSNHDLVNLPLESEIGDFMTYETSCHIRNYSVTPSRVTKFVQVKDNQKKYIFKDISRYNIFDLIMSNGNLLLNDTIVLNEGGHLASTSIESSIIDDGIMELNVSLGFNYGNINVYGKDKDGDWELVTSISIDSYEYKNYIVGFDVSKQYMSFKLENTSLNEIRMKGISFSTIKNGMTYEFKTLDIQYAKISQTSDTTTIHMGKEICGDTRHEGKHFAMAVQFKESNGQIIENITNITITIKGVTYQPYHSQSGSAIVYFDLTTILNELALDELVITINCPDSYFISCAELLETISIQKPAMSEVRYIYSQT